MFMAFVMVISCRFRGSPMRIWIYGGSPEEIQEMIEKASVSKYCQEPRSGRRLILHSAKWFNSGYICCNAWEFDLLQLLQLLS